jgi:hypothetical protein
MATAGEEPGPCAVLRSPCGREGGGRWQRHPDCRPLTDSIAWSPGALKQGQWRASAAGGGPLLHGRMSTSSALARALSRSAGSMRGAIRALAACSKASIRTPVTCSVLSGHGGVHGPRHRQHDKNLLTRHAHSPTSRNVPSPEMSSRIVAVVLARSCCLNSCTVMSMSGRRATTSQITVTHPVRTNP